MDDERKKEDRELVRRLSDAPARYTYTVNVGPQTSAEVDRYLREFRRKHKESFKNLLDPKDDDFLPG